MTTRPLSVRPATLRDLDAIVELRLALLHEYRDHPLYRELRPNAAARAHELYRSQILSPYETIFVAVRGRTVIGLMRCVETAASPVLMPERYCYVSSVYVVPAERKKGVLRALLAAADKWCHDREITEMRLNNSTTSPTARASWSALGFEIVEEVRRRELGTAPKRERARVERGRDSRTSAATH
jgi:GNAT superfamily N-acetyltransferase